MRAYLKLKACPRCSGDILVDSAFEDAEVCIQCGFRKFTRTIHRTHPQSQLENTVTVVKRQAKRKTVAKA